jgi:hypothetical protein
LCFLFIPKQIWIYLFIDLFYLFLILGGTNKWFVRREKVAKGGGGGVVVGWGEVVKEVVVMGAHEEAARRARELFVEEGPVPEVDGDVASVLVGPGLHLVPPERGQVEDVAGVDVALERLGAGEERVARQVRLDDVHRTHDLAHTASVVFGQDTHTPHTMHKGGPTMDVLSVRTLREKVDVSRSNDSTASLMCPS